MWPGIFSLAAGIGLPRPIASGLPGGLNAFGRYSRMLLIFTLVVGLVTLGLAEVLIPHLIGDSQSGSFAACAIYLLVIPILMLTDLTRGLLEGARRFTWVGCCA